LPGLKGQLQNGDLVVFTHLNMPNFRKVLFLLLMSAAVLLGFSGCFSPQQDSSIPWSRPAEWEGRIPGMGK